MQTGIVKVELNYIKKEHLDLSLINLIHFLPCPIGGQRGGGGWGAGAYSRTIGQTLNQLPDHHWA